MTADSRQPIGAEFDRRGREAVVRMLAVRYPGSGLVYHPNPATYSRLDGKIMRDDMPIATCEAKARDTTYADLGRLYGWRTFISSNKVDRGVIVAQRHGLPMIGCWVWGCGTITYRMLVRPDGSRVTAGVEQHVTTTQANPNNGGRKTELVDYVNVSRDYAKVIDP